MRAFFVGGPAAGQIREIDGDHYYWQVAELGPPVYKPTDTAEDIRTKITTYRRHTIRISGNTFHVFAPTRWDGDEIFLHVFEQYFKR